MSAFSPQEPPENVLGSFGAQDPSVRMLGGQGTSFRAGHIVLKPVSDPEESNWIADLFARLDGPGFRVPRPIAAVSGQWIVDGWSASEFVAAEHAGPNGGRWPETIAACRAFHAALRGIREPAFIGRADHPWALADRLAFGELRLEPLPPFASTIERLNRVLRPIQAESQLIHGDFTANVLFAEGQPPCVIDFSPYWRPSAFAEAVVIADAIAWTGADHSLVGLCAVIPDFPQYFARAVLRRIWENDQHVRRGRLHSEEYLLEYLPAVDLALRLASASPG